MKRRLFLTGDMGAGKSTAIALALGEKMPDMGGFLTRRQMDEQGRPVFFSLETPDGENKAVFLDVSSETPRVFMEAFQDFGISALQGECLLLDEIGGIELLNPAFCQALEEALKRDVPILGVVKGRNASHALAKRLGLTEKYHQQTEKLWDFLIKDENTLIYTCEKYDEKALALAAQWVREYCL